MILKIHSMQLITEKIIIGKNSFIGARAMVLPGVEIGENAIIGAQSVVTKDVLKLMKPLLVILHAK